MWPLDVNAPFQVGDWVSIKDSTYKRVRIVEYRGAWNSPGKVDTELTVIWIAHTPPD